MDPTSNRYRHPLCYESISKEGINTIEKIRGIKWECYI